MYAIFDEYLIDEVGIDGLPAGIRKKIEHAKRALQADAEPAAYQAEKQSDGSFQLFIPTGIGRMLLGYDVDEDQQIIILNYLKSDWFGGAIEWFGGLLGAEPGREK